jgi:hypothetical protein
MIAVWIIVIAVGAPTWLLIGVGFGTAIGLESVASLTWRIRRLERNGKGTEPG